MKTMELLVVKIEDKTSGNGKNYVLLTATDGNARYSIYCWDVIGEKVKTELKKGNVAFLSFDPEAKFMNLEGFSHSDTSPDQFIPYHYPSESEGERILDEMLQKIKDPVYQAINEKIFTPTFRKLFIQGVGGLNQHHVLRGELLSHTHEVFEFVEAIVQSKRYKGEVDQDLALEGALLHDIGKVLEYKSEYGGTELTKWYHLAGHLAIGAEMIAKAGEGLPKMRVEQLKHVVRSHHLQQEWGAIVTPKLLEAFLVFLGDYWSVAVNKRENAEFNELGVGTSRRFREVFIYTE